MSFMSSFGSLGSASASGAPAAAAGAGGPQGEPPGYPFAKNLQLVFRDKSNGKIYGTRPYYGTAAYKAKSPGPVAIYGEVAFDRFGQYATQDGGMEHVRIDSKALIEAPGGVLVGGGNRHKSRKSTRRKSRR